MNEEVQEKLNIKKPEIIAPATDHIDEYIKVYIYIFELAVRGKIDARSLVSTARYDITFQLMRIVMLEDNALRMDEIQLDETQMNLPIFRTKLVIDYKNDVMIQEHQEKDGETSDAEQTMKRIKNKKKRLFIFVRSK